MSNKELFPAAWLCGIDDGEFAHLRKSFTGLATKRREYLTLLQSV
ncbi:MAG: hypothetical protein RIR09_85 [Pseudomonadota bacterium]|jgi:hypothetical protein